ncbi:hypothetical protein N7519_008717 [Penicillium mononematosum]|uniref:uncharacterized protein n=1 Tax=Penicillium mononematosum TaxID=268346 RepID=UPI002546D353|nr:uncharacterized protein N7519_008717 [Penicillium mononematosum]KAJ6178256.1 hypothetical protein N7519_008717 [Penicillium mononematosum]
MLLLDDERVSDLGGRDSEGRDITADSDWLVVVTGQDISCIAAQSGQRMIGSALNPTVVLRWPLRANKTKRDGSIEPRFKNADIQRDVSNSGFLAQRSR